MDAPHADSLPQTAPPSPSPRKWLRRIGWILVWSATTLFLAISLFDAYCIHRYEASVAKAKAAGMPDSWGEILPKPVADADNFGALEEFKPFLAVEEVPCPPSNHNPLGRKLKYLDESGMEALKNIRPLRITGGSLKSLGPFEARSLKDLRKKAVEDERLNSDSSNLSDSDAILKVFAGLEPFWSRLLAAKQRTHAILYLPLKPSLVTPSSMASPSLNLAHIAQLKARAFISANRGTDALEESLLLLKIADLRAFPSLIENLVRTTKIGILMPVLFEGISQHVWSDSQLATLEKSIASYDLLSDLKQDLGGEALYARGLKEMLHSSSMNVPIFALMSPVGEQGSSFSGAEKLLPSVIPRTLLNIRCTGSLETIFHWVELLSRKDARHLRELMKQPELHWGPLNSFAGSLAPAIGGVIKTIARGQTLLNIARVAVALERHRLRHGSFPPTLNALAPDYLPSIPTEVFDGAPLHYALKDKAQGFMLYSTGWKGTDDGRAMDYSKPNETNWTWSSP